MASRALMLREGIAPVRDRLLTTLLLAGLLHAVVILGVTFSASAAPGPRAPALDVVLVSDELPEADKNDTATYLAQRTQLGSGNTRKPVPPRNRASALSLPSQPGQPDGKALGPKGKAHPQPQERILASTAWHARVNYLMDPGVTGSGYVLPALISEQTVQEPGPADEAGPAQLRGPRRDELWITPDSKASVLAPYLDAWRRKVERIGTLNYPAIARRPGSADAAPVVEVAIDSQGKLRQAIIRASSGSAELDQAALAILKLASPFDPFPPEVARRYRMLRFAYEWQFLGGRVGPGVLSTVP